MNQQRKFLSQTRFRFKTLCKHSAFNYVSVPQFLQTSDDKTKSNLKAETVYVFILQFF